MNTEQENQSMETRKLYRGKLAYYHPNGKGQGLAARFELRLNRDSRERYDCFFLDLAKQKPSDGKTAAFDWEGRVTVKLDFTDICELLLVLEGRQTSAGAKGNGLYHQTEAATTLIEFRRDEDRPGILLGVSKKARDGDILFRGQLRLTEAEAIGLRCCFQTGLFYLVYHENLEPA